MVLLDFWFPLRAAPILLLLVSCQTSPSTKAGERPGGVGAGGNATPERIQATSSHGPEESAETSPPSTGASGGAPKGAFESANGPVDVPLPLSHQGLGQDLSLLPAKRSGVTVQNIHRYGAADAARVVVELSSPTAFDVGWLKSDASSGPRLFVDIQGASYEGPPTFEVGGVLRKVRVASRADGVRLVLDLKTEVERSVFYVPEPFRLILDVSSGSSRANLGPDGRPPVRRVVLDPGHGGHDPGAVGPSGLREKDVTLDIATRAAPLIAQELGLATLLTRDSDVYVPLHERTAKANAFNADLFVSIHCNASEHGHGEGIMTFVLDSSTDAYAARIAALENAASAKAASELASTLRRELDADVMAQSSRLARLLQRATLATLSPQYGKVTDHGVKRSGFYVLAGAHMPAVLFEASFISNSAGESRLNNGDYRQKLADGIVNAIRAFREGK